MAAVQSMSMSRTAGVSGTTVCSTSGQNAQPRPSLRPLRLRPAVVDGRVPGSRRVGRLIAKASEGGKTNDGLNDNHILEYCTLKKEDDKKTIGELEQEYLDALRSFYYDEKPILTNAEFDELKNELLWQGSSVAVLSSDEQRFLEAAKAYIAGKPIISDEEYDAIKRKLKLIGSPITNQGPRCSLRSKKVYSDSVVDYVRMVAINIPGAVITLALLFLVDDITGFEITYLLELPEPWSAIVLYGLVLPTVYAISQRITSLALTDPLILRGPCPNCLHPNNSFFGSIFGVGAAADSNDVVCEDCGAKLRYTKNTRQIVLEGLKPLKPPEAPAGKKGKAAKKAEPVEA